MKVIIITTKQEIIWWKIQDKLKQNFESFYSDSLKGLKKNETNFDRKLLPNQCRPQNLEM